MTTKENLTKALYQAMKSGDQVTKTTIRMVLSSIKLAEVDQQQELDDNAVIAIVQKEIKMRQEAIHEAQKGDRQDIIDKNTEEIEVLKKFLPEQLSEEEVRMIVAEVIAQTNASGMRDMGNVMKTVIPRIKGQAPNQLVSRIVKESLSN